MPQFQAGALPRRKAKRPKPAGEGKAEATALADSDVEEADIAALARASLKEGEVILGEGGGQQGGLVDLEVADKRGICNAPALLQKLSDIEYKVPEGAKRVPWVDTLAIEDQQTLPSDVKPGLRGPRMAEMRAALSTESGESCPAARGCHSRAFPADVCPCCPCLRPGLKHIKDWLHLVLLLGVVSSVGIVVMEIVEITSSTWSCQSPLCMRQWILLLMLFPTMCDFIKSMVAYDGTLQSYQEKQEEVVNLFIEQINSQVSDMQVVSGKLTENANDFAARAFHQSLQRFEEFIVNIRRPRSKWHQDPELVDALRTFICKWFTVYCQSQLHQDQHPSATGLREELGRCRDAEALGRRAAERLAVLKRAARIELPAQSFLLDPRQEHARALADGGLEAGAAGSRGAAARGGRGPSGRGRVRWARLGWAGCGRQRQRAADGAGWPLTLGFGCGALTILSGRHLNLLGYLLVDAALICWELVHPQLQRYTMTMALLAVNTVCVISTLACFEQLDEIAKLQQRISKYQAMSEKMKVEFKQVNDKWKKVQQLHDLWNYRTMPFLAIMGKIQNALDDKERSDDLQVEWLRRANDSLEILDEKLGLASDWTEAGQQPRTKEWKETIGRQLRNEEQREDVDELIHFLPMLTNPQLSMWSSFSTPDAGRA